MKDNNCTKICSFEHFLIRTSKIRLSPDEITDDILAKANLTRSKYYKRSVKSSQVSHFWSDGWQCFSPQAGLDLDGDTQRVRSSCSFWLLSKKKLHMLPGMRRLCSTKCSKAFKKTFQMGASIGGSSNCNTFDENTAKSPLFCQGTNLSRSFLRWTLGSKCATWCSGASKISYNKI